MDKKVKVVGVGNQVFAEQSNILTDLIRQKLADAKTLGDVARAYGLGSESLKATERRHRNRHAPRSAWIQAFRSVL